MTDTEILEYNKRCALFLGAELILTDHTEGNEQYCKENKIDKWIIETWTTPLSMKHLENLYGIGYFRYINLMKYHSDWNWIMEVVEAIEELDVVSSFQIEQPTIYIWESSEQSNFKDIQIDINTSSKKEAVVKAINQFLIWNEQQNNLMKNLEPMHIGDGLYFIDEGFAISIAVNHYTNVVASLDIEYLNRAIAYLEAAKV